MDKSGEKPPLEAELADALERWIRADKWLRKHLSVSKVWSMMIIQYDYSDLTARRDVYDAQCFVSSTAQQKRSYWAGLVLDRLGQGMLDAIADRKWADMARIAKEIREYMKFTEEVDQIDAKDLLKPIPRRIAFQPEILNVKHDPRAREKVLALVREITGDDSFVIDHAERTPSAHPRTDVICGLDPGSAPPNTELSARTGNDLDAEISMMNSTMKSNGSSQTGTHFQKPRSRSS